ncbi:MAG: helix-turn-helix transcriptional regulator [Treponema sp.]|nr:helix-turn-helix transcriptional regulator [Treponema sp.]
MKVSPKVAFAIELRKARAGHSQKEVAEKAGMTYQQYQRLENPHKTNPTMETLYKLQKVFNHRFLAL